MSNCFSKFVVIIWWVLRPVWKTSHIWGVLVIGTCICSAAGCWNAFACLIFHHLYLKKFPLLRWHFLVSGSPQVISMLGNSYPTAGGPLSQSHVQVNNLSSMGMLNDVNSNDSSPFDINDFPQLTSRPSSAGGPQGQLG